MKNASNCDAGLLYKMLRQSSGHQMPFNKNIFSFLAIAFFWAGFGLPPVLDASVTENHLQTLGAHIETFNGETRKKDILDKRYRGEEGILRIRPEAGKRFGLKVSITPEYTKAKALYKEADEVFEKILDAMSSRKKASIPDEHAQTVARLALKYNRTVDLAWQNLMTYQAGLTPETDERLNPVQSRAVLEKRLAKNLEKSSYNLRDGLGGFYNQCQGLNKKGPLNLENIKFVNYVFYEFTKNATEAVLACYDLDIVDENDAENSLPYWKYAMGKSSSRFVSEIESVYLKHRKTGYPVDILLFMALMWQESAYEPRNVSYVGAAGLTQIMPSTAKGLGMTDIYDPPYFKEAGSFLGRERRLKNKARRLIPLINEENSLEMAGKALGLMQEAMDCNQKWKDLYARYRRELLKRGDDRLNAKKAIQYGLKYFSQMMKIQKGDASLALASYNAGPHRIKQYHGIPPFEETIDFRNRVIQYYREYLSRVEKYRTPVEITD